LDAKPEKEGKTEIVRREDREEDERAGKSKEKRKGLKLHQLKLMRKSTPRKYWTKLHLVHNNQLV